MASSCERQVPVWRPSAEFTDRLISDRYVIRTRNLQDWNLTRYRCANRSVEGSVDAATAQVVRCAAAQVRKSCGTLQKSLAQDHSNTKVALERNWLQCARAGAAESAARLGRLSV